MKMTMLNTKVKQIEMDTIQQEPLFTELTPEAAAVVEGSGISSFGERVKFDWYRDTKSFTVKSGGSITLSSSTTSGKNNKFFSAAVRNVKTGNSTPGKSVRVGKGIFTRWTGMKGGTYKIDFRDTKDGVYVSGNIGVAYSS